MFSKSSLLASIQDGLTKATGEAVELEWLRNLPGGDINRAALIRGGHTKWFLKFHQQAPEGMFAAEAQALQEISAQGCIKVPAPAALGSTGETDWLVLEYLELASHGATALLGEQLAALHAVTAVEFGWSRNNYIGSTPQINTCCDDWAQFWRDYRLRPQFELAGKAGHGGAFLSKGEQLLECISAILNDHKPAPSLLHGDLWAGNKAFTSDGQPVIFDPASYYGDREADIAMTELFGGFEQSFYSAYEAHHPLPDGYPVRRNLYNLYHMLNHLNLFGAGYLSRCIQIIDKLLAEVR
jgi:fructosamine-3-kinase